MAKLICSAAYDACHTKTATGTHITVCSTQPANYAAISGVKLAAVTVTAGDGNGCYTIGAGAGGGGSRKVAVAQQTGVSITGSGTATYVVIDDGALLLAATTCTSQVLTSGGTVTIPAFAHELADPT